MDRRAAAYEDEDARSVAAASTRIVAKMQVGRNERHTLHTSGISILAALAMAIGSVWGYATSDAGQVQEVQETVPVRIGEGSLDVPQAIADFDPNAIVAVVDSSCGAPTSGIAVVLESGVVITSQKVVASARRPIIVTADGSRVPATLVGWSIDADIAVLEPAEELQFRTSFGATGGIQSSAELAVVQGTVGGISLLPVVVKEVKGTNGVRETFTIVAAAEDLNLLVAPELALRASTLVIDRNGRVVGVGNAAGSATLAEAIKPIVGQLRASAETPRPSC